MGKSKKGGVRIKQMGGKMPPAITPEDFQMNPADMEQIQLPPPIDRNYKVIWPLSQSFTMKFDKFPVIYPNYIDARKPSRLGRKIATAKAVDHPNVSDISCVLQELQIRHVIEGYKGYSKDTECHYENLGRVRYDDVFDIDQVPSDLSNTLRKRRLMELIASRIPDLPSRKLRLEQEAEERAKLVEERAKAEAAGKPKITSGAANIKKKGKKGKRK